MSFTIKTTKIQEMVSKAIKGASNNKMIPITSLIAIECKNGKLTLTTTDASNILTVSTKVDDGNFYVAVQSEIFSRLISKITAENVTMDLKDTTLEVKANGTYHIELPVDEDGNLIKLPSYSFDSKAKKINIKKEKLKSILSANRAALANTMENPILTAYYFGDQVITTDSFKVCSNDAKLFNSPILLSSSMVDLLDIFEGEQIVAKVSGNKLLFSSGDIVLYGTEFPGIEDFPADAIKAYLGTEFTHNCLIQRSKFLEILDRLVLFVSEYDQNGIYLTFNSEGIQIRSKKSDGIEVLTYEKKLDTDSIDYSCLIDIELLRSQITAQPANTIKIWFGHDSAIKISSDEITQIIALLEDEGVVGNGEE